MQLSDRILSLQESATIKMAQASRELQRKGVDIINLSLGEPDFDTPEHIKRAAEQALEDGYTSYPPVPGFPELREAISRKFERDNGLKYSPDQIVVSNGAKQSIANVILSVINPGDQVVVPSPYWVSYQAQIQLAGGELLEVVSDIDSGYKINPEQLEAAINEKTRIFLFSSPCNPTGSVYSRSELKALAEVLAKYPDILIVADEIYEYINFTDEHVSIGQFEELNDRVVTVNGFSKGFAMTGWRIGYLGAPLSIAKACTKMQGQFTSGANSFSQIACIAALDGDMNPTYDMRDAFKRRRDLVLKELSGDDRMKLNHPEGAFYVFPDISGYFGLSHGEHKIENPDDFCMYLLDEAHVAVVTGRAFGDDNGFRFSYASSDEQLTKAIARIHEALKKLQ